MLKVTSKTLMINVENEVSIGNDAITATVIHQICFYEKNDGGIGTDVDFIDVENIKFIGVTVGETYKEWVTFKEKMMELGVNVDKELDEVCVGLIKTEDLNKLKVEYRPLFQ